MAGQTRKEEALTLVQRLRESLGAGNGGQPKRPSPTNSNQPNYGNRSVHLRQGKLRGKESDDPFGSGGPRRPRRDTDGTDSGRSRGGQDESDLYKTTQVLDVDSITTAHRSFVPDATNGRWRPNLGLGLGTTLGQNIDDKLEDLDSLKSPRHGVGGGQNNKQSMYHTLMSFNSTGGGNKGFENEKLGHRFGSNLPPSAPPLDIDDWRPSTQQSIQPGKISALSNDSSDSKLTIDDDTQALCNEKGAANSTQSPKKMSNTKLAIGWFLLGVLVGLLIMFIISMASWKQAKCSTEILIENQSGVNGTKTKDSDNSCSKDSKNFKRIAIDCQAQLKRCKREAGIYDNETDVSTSTMTSTSSDDDDDNGLDDQSFRTPNPDYDTPSGNRSDIDGDSSNSSTIVPETTEKNYSDEDVENLTSGTLTTEESERRRTSHSDLKTQSTDKSDLETHASGNTPSPFTSSPSNTSTSMAPESDEVETQSSTSDSTEEYSAVTFRPKPDLGYTKSMDRFTKSPSVGSSTNKANKSSGVTDSNFGFTSAETSAEEAEINITTPLDGDTSVTETPFENHASTGAHFDKNLSVIRPATKNPINVTPHLDLSTTEIPEDKTSFSTQNVRTSSAGVTKPSNSEVPGKKRTVSTVATTKGSTYSSERQSSTESEEIDGGGSTKTTTTTFRPTRNSISTKKGEDSEENPESSDDEHQKDVTKKPPGERSTVPITVTEKPRRLKTTRKPGFTTHTPTDEDDTDSGEFIPSNSSSVPGKIPIENLRKDNYENDGRTTPMSASHPNSRNPRDGSNSFPSTYRPSNRILTTPYNPNDEAETLSGSKDDVVTPTSSASKDYASTPPGLNDQSPSHPNSNDVTRRPSTANNVDEESTPPSINDHSPSRSSFNDLTQRPSTPSNGDETATPSDSSDEASTSPGSNDHSPPHSGSNDQTRRPSTPSNDEEASTPSDSSDEASTPSDSSDEASTSPGSNEVTRRPSPPNNDDEASTPSDSSDEASTPSDSSDEASTPSDANDEASTSPGSNEITRRSSTPHNDGDASTHSDSSDEASTSPGSNEVTPRPFTPNNDDEASTPSDSSEEATTTSGDHDEAGTPTVADSSTPPPTSTRTALTASTALTEPPNVNSGSGSNRNTSKRKKQKGWFQRFLDVVKDVINTVTPFQVKSREDGNLDIAVQ